jgi:hypothetical protein
MPIIAYDPASTVAVQYDRLANEMMSTLQSGVIADNEGELKTRLGTMKRAFEEARSRLSGQGGLQKVVLRFYVFTGQEVKLAGSFNDWRPDQGVVTRTENGVVEKIVMLMPGTYQYRLVVDGIWQEDPSNPKQVSNYSGGYNSVLQVEEEHETEHA